MGIGRLAYIRRCLALIIWNVFSGFFLVYGQEQYLGLVGFLMLFGGFIWYMFFVVPSRLLNAGMPRVWLIGLIVPLLNIVVWLILLFAPPAVYSEPSLLNDADVEPGPRRDYFIELISKIFLSDTKDDETTQG